MLRYTILYRSEGRDNLCSNGGPINRRQRHKPRVSNKSETSRDEHQDITHTWCINKLHASKRMHQRTKPEGEAMRLSDVAKKSDPNSIRQDAKALSLFQT